MPQQPGTPSMAPLRVDPRQVMENLHDQYKSIIEKLVQENAQISAAVINLKNELADERAKRAALTPKAATPGNPAGD